MATAPVDGPGFTETKFSNTTYASFMERRVRQGFIRKVYGILTVQLAMTFGITFLFVLNESVKTWVQTHPGAFWSAIGLQIGICLVLACVPSASRVVPYNYLLLLALTLTESYLLGTASSRYDTDVVLIAAGITVGVTLGLTIFAFQMTAHADESRFHCVHCLVYAWMGAMVFCGFIVVDTQMMIGGKHSIQFTPDDYIFAAINLYLDIINLFLYLLRLLDALRNRD